MTISSENRVAGPYTGNGSTASFPFSFKVFSKADLLVVRTDEYGADTPLALGLDFDAVLNADQDSNPGGVVNLGAAPSSTNTVTITSDVAPLQETNLTNQGGFYPKVITNALDKLTVLIQQIKARSGRAISAPLSDGAVDLVIPGKSTRAGMALGFDSDGNPLAFPVNSIQYAEHLADTLAARDAATAVAATAIAASGAAESAKAGAISARDSAIIQAGLYPDEATGRAAVADGQAYKVQGSGDIAAYEYRRISASSSTLLATYPSSEMIRQRFNTDIERDDLVLVFIDANDRILMAIDSNGALRAKIDIGIGVANGLAIGTAPNGSPVISLGTEEGRFPLGDGELNASHPSMDYLYAIVDANDRILMAIDSNGTIIGKFSGQSAYDEVVTARGTSASLSDRLAPTLSPAGLPKSYIYGEWFLREVRQRLRKIALGESAQLTIAAIGDSWTHNRDRWTKPFANTLAAEYGDAGPGWAGFGNLNGTFLNGNVDSSKVGVSFSGTWDHTVYYSAPSPDLGQATATSSGKITVTGPASCSAVKLFYAGTTGNLRYRWDGGSWTTLDTTGSGPLIATLSGLPSTTWSLEIEWVSGTVTLYGVDVQKSASGIRFHKLGATGSSTNSWTSPNAANWQTNLAALAPNAVIVMLATNDQSSMAPAAYAEKLQILISRIKTALPLADIAIVAPCENGRANTYPMTGFTSAAYAIAYANKCAFLDLQYVFGEQFSEYASTSPRAWFNADLIHPEPSSGGRVITDAIYRLFTKI